MTTANTLAALVNSSSQIVVPSGGVNFGTSTDGTGTVTGGVLDDYEEGTFSPSITGATSGASSGGSKLGVYTKIGRTVFVSINCTNISKNDISGYVQVSLPFTVQDNRNSSGTCRYGGFATNTGTVTVIPQTGDGNAYVVLQMFNQDDYLTNVSDSHLDASFDLYNITYIYNT